MKFVIKFPTRNRPEKFKQVFMKYQHMRSGNHEVRFVVSMDEDDAKMNTPEIRKFLDAQTNVKYFYGQSKSKIQAINADLEHLGAYDILMLASDDMVPTEPNYDEIIASDMQKHYPDMDGVLHYNDGRVGNILNTFCIMGSKYFDRFGYIYHPSYVSVFCDNEFDSVSKILNRTTYIDRQLFYHGWIQFVGYDELAQRNENQEMYNIDGATFKARREADFDLQLA